MEIIITQMIKNNVSPSYNFLKFNANLTERKIYNSDFHILICFAIN